jgi:hypothetical protein
MSGLIKFKFGFENHLKICFEKLEKEKKKKRKVGLFRISARLSLPCRGPLTSPRPPSPAWAEPRHGLLAQHRARAFLLPGVTLTSGAHASAAQPSSSSPRRTPASLSMFTGIESIFESFPFLASACLRAIKTEPPHDSAPSQPFWSSRNRLAPPP